MKNNDGSKVVIYFGQPMRVNCDRKCNKAWGINSRPKVQLSDDIDDYAYLSDGELGEAPTDPGTYEGGVGKPERPSEFPTKWCVRECERCERSAPGKHNEPVELENFNLRVFNIQRVEGELPPAEER